MRSSKVNPSRTALAMIGRVVAKVRPRMAPLEEVSSHGVPLPEKWGKTIRLVGPAGASPRIKS